MISRTPLDYADWRRKLLGRVTEQVEKDAVLQLAGQLEGRDVLDVGCGDGPYVLAAADAGARAAGVDVSAVAVARARERATTAGHAVDLRVADARRLPFPDAMFDVVLAVTVLCFVQDPQRAVTEMARVLRPGGVVVLGELGRLSTWAAWRRVRGWLGSRTWRHARFWTSGELRKILASAGLVPERTVGVAFYPPFGVIARALARLDPVLGARTTVGAAFVAVRAWRPPENS
jgi:ubiquinone/menaquinone biosynthesis C-methylase UbiE